MTAARRHFIAAGLALPASLALAQARAAGLVAAMTEGPFYPAPAWRSRNSVNTDDWDADLTRVRRGSQVVEARGETLGLQLQVADRQGRQIDGCEVEIWQCDTLQAYRHPGVAAEQGRYDPGFQGFGAARTAADGSVAFRTIRPVAYPGRTPHIHIKLRHPSFGEVTSQLFVAGDPGNTRDFLWRRLDADEQTALAMKLLPGGADGTGNAPAGLRWQVQQRLLLPT